MIPVPELRRYVWLELTPTRLAVAPALVIVGCMVLSGMLGATVSWPIIDYLAYWGFVLFTGIWGARLAGGAILQELRDGTWDWQRMSSLPPARQAWGKLLGAPVAAWWWGVVLLAAMGLARAKSELSGAVDLPGYGVVVLSLVVTALLAHGTLLLFALQRADKGSVRAKRMESLGLYAISLMFLPLFAAKDSIVDILFRDEFVIWFGQIYERQDFQLVASVGFLTWVLIGLKRGFEAAFGYERPPLVWLGFMVFVSIFVAGLSPYQPRFGALDNLLLPMCDIFLTAIGLAVLLAVIDGKDRQRLTRIAGRLRGGGLLGGFRLAPVWLVTLGVAALALIAIVGLWQVAGDPLGVVTSVTFGLPVPVGPGLPWVVGAVFLLALRDVALVHVFHFASKGRRGGAVTVIYFLMVYAILPMLLRFWLFKGAEVMFWPSPQSADVAPVAFVLAALQAVAAGVLLIRKVGNARS